MLRTCFQRGQRVSTLSKAMQGRRSGNAFRKTAEQQMLSVASQLFKCLHILHEEKELCHLGVNPEGISFKIMPVKPWDRVALTDSGSEGDVMQKVKPLLQRHADGEATSVQRKYASLEQLRSLHYQMQGDDHHGDVLIDGQASDIFSTGIVLYEMLVGQLPFDCTQSRHLKADQAPDSVRARDWVHEWEQNGAMLSAQDEWRDAVFSARWEAAKTRQPLNIKHPLLHHARMHSANPELAADFFLGIFHPVASLRRDLPSCYHHPYLATAGDVTTYQQGAGQLLTDVGAAPTEQSCLPGFPLCLMGQQRQSSRCSPAVVSQHGSASRGPGHLQAATAGSSPTDSICSSSSSSSSTWAVRQRLKSTVKKISPQASDLSTSSGQQQEDVQQLQQQQQQHDVKLVAVPSEASTGAIEPLVMPASSTRKQCLSMMRGVFRRKRVAEEAECAKGGVTESQVEPADVHLIAAVRAPSSGETQGEAFGDITTPGNSGSQDQSKEGVKQKLARLLSLSKHCSVSRLSGRMTALLDLSRN